MKVAREVGNCQICEGDFKLRKGELVHHGYKRPGHGSIVGDCPGVGFAPYEVSCERAREYAEMVREQRASHLRRAAKLEAGEVRYLVEIGWNRKLVEYAVGVSPDYLWGSKVKEHKVNEEYAAKACAREIARMEARIAAWEPRAVRSVEEEQEKAAAQQRASAEAKRAKYEAKVAAEKAKAERREAMEVRKAAKRAQASAWVREVAGMPEGYEKRMAALAVRDGMKKKFGFYSWQLEEVRSELRDLGVW